MFKIKNLLTLVCACCFYVCQAQKDTTGFVVTIQFKAKQPNNPAFNKIDTLFVRNNHILEPIKVTYSKGKTDLRTGVSREISAGKRLQSYNLTNYIEMIGMNFDIEEKISAKTIETYRLSDGHKLGIGFINEPYLRSGFSIADFTKDKDTIINGAKCFLIKNKVVPTVKGREDDRILQFRIAINPVLKSYAVPFISEKIVQHFGGGAIVYLVAITEKGSKTTVQYTYSCFTSVETKLFDQYKAFYDANITLLDRFKKK